MNERQQSDSDPDPDILLFDTSPTREIDAIVQSDERTIYFYLNGSAPFGARACWVRNLVPGPLVVDVNEMIAGRPPLLPRTAEKPDAPRGVPSPDDLSIVWFEECNGAALLESGEVLAIIPPWSGEDGFWGYARDAANQTLLCSPLPDHPDMTKRLVRAAEFWAAFEDLENDPFQRLQPELLNSLEQRLGHADSPYRYFTIDGGKFPPRGLVVFTAPQHIVAVTVGMSLLPQPNVELVDSKPWLRRRVELAIRIPRDTSEETQQHVWNSIAGLAGYPWRSQTWFGEGHTVEFPVLKDIFGDDVSMVRLSAEPPDPLPAVKLSNFRDDPINLLWMIPTTTPASADAPPGSGEGP